jgi:hypothetical protein
MKIKLTLAAAIAASTLCAGAAAAFEMPTFPSSHVTNLPLLNVYANPPGEPIPPAGLKKGQCRKWCQNWKKSCDRTLNQVTHKVKKAEQDPAKKAELQAFKVILKTMYCAPDGAACKANCG